MEKIFKVEGMHCPHCAKRVESALSELNLSVKVELERGEVKVSGDSLTEPEVKERIEELGFEVK